MEKEIFISDVRTFETKGGNRRWALQPPGRCRCHRR
jgi:hypothetical protein